MPCLVASVLVTAMLISCRSGGQTSVTVADHVALGTGRPQLLDFGRGECTPCRRMKPVMEEASTMLGHQLDVRMLDVRRRDNERLAKRFQMTSMPLIVLLDAEGRELWRHEGFLDFTALSEAVNEHLDGSGGLCKPTQTRCEP